MVALYWLENFLFTNWFIKEVFPTLQQVCAGTCGCWRSDWETKCCTLSLIAARAYET